jgi:transglutaminase-like putative cysteine protease
LNVFRLAALRPRWSGAIARYGARRFGSRSSSIARRISEDCLKLRLGYEFEYLFPAATPCLLQLSVHYTRASDLSGPDAIKISPNAKISGYRDGFGNWCCRTVAPAGVVKICGDTVVYDSGEADPTSPEAGQVRVEHLPDEALVFLLPSRFCESDKLLDLAWTLFGKVKPGWERVQAICDYVNGHIAFDYMQARPTRTAAEGYQERVGVCRDYAHLAVSFCRALNIPARYCTGYLSDVGMPEPYPPGDFAAWMEVYLDGGWWLFDPRNNTRRQGRVLIARGRDAADVAMITTFGPNKLQSFKVWADEVRE